VIQSIDNSICSDDKLTDGIIFKFGYNAPSFRELAQAFGVLNEEFAKAQSSIRIVD